MLERSNLGSIGLIVVLLARFLVAGVSAQQSRNVDLLGTLNPYTQYTDIWGYRSPAGREYALLAVDVGTSVIDCTYPAQPVERGFISGPMSILRDIKTLFDVGQRRVVFFDDFEGGDAWTHGGSGDDWERGSPLGLGGNAKGFAWLDPWYAHSGDTVWGNDLGLAGSDGIYPSSASSWLQSMEIPTQGVRGLRLRLRRWLTVEGSGADRARIRINEQIVWQNGGPHHLDFRWNRMDLDVSSVLDSAASAIIRFELQTNNDMEIGGWQLDDVELFALEGGGNEARGRSTTGHVTLPR